MSSFKRKSYGPVKAVPKPKPIPPTKPSVLELHRLYRLISKASSNRHIDFFAQALYWWQDATKFIKYKRPIAMEPVSKSRQFLSACEWVRKGQAAKTNDEKERCFVSAMDAYRQYASGLIETHDVKPYLKEYHGHNKKVAKVVQKIAPRFDPFLTMLAACFNSCPLTLQVVPDIDGNRGEVRKFDHDLGKMLYSRALALKLMRQYRTKGLLAVAVDEALPISRAMSFGGISKGAFIVDKEKQLIAYSQLMADVVEFAATHPDAPARLVKRIVAKVSKRSPRATGSKLVRFKEKSINQQLLDELAVLASRVPGIE